MGAYPNTLRGGGVTLVTNADEDELMQSIEEDVDSPAYEITQEAEDSFTRDHQRRSVSLKLASQPREMSGGPLINFDGANDNAVLPELGEIDEHDDYDD
ncbi:hypothetical protein LTR66_015122, partial [Elasticomyces elasticus]